MNISYFAWLGTIYLFFLTWQDYKNNMMVDDRKNYFMLGIALSVYSHVYTSLIYKIAVTIVTIGVYKFMMKIKAFGEADINSITWIFLGMGYINPYQLLAFLVIFSITTLSYYYLNALFCKILKKESRKIQFYGVILINFVLNMFLFKMY